MNDEIVDYKTLEAATARDLDTAVRQLIRDDKTWRPQGGVAIGTLDGGPRYAQAMVKIREQ